MATLAVCQYFNPILHGECDEAIGHYLALHTYDEEYDESPYGFLDFWTPSDYEDLIMLNQEVNNSCRSVINKLYNSHYNSNNNDINEITSIRELQKFPKVDIVETINLDSGHTVAIKKTVWLSIFQRMLKKRYSKTNNTNNSLLGKRLRKT